MLCGDCGERMAAEQDYNVDTPCPVCEVRGQLRPDVVWFGEMPYHMEEIEARLADCDLFIAVGTSGVVYPAAGFVQQALLQGALTVEINKEVSEVTGLFHLQRKGVATTEVTTLVEELLAG